MDTNATMIKDLSFAPDGSLLAVVMHGDNEVRLWDVTKDRMILLSPDQQLANCTAVFSPSGDMLAWATIARESPPWYEVRLFDTANRSTMGRVARGPLRALTAVPLAFSPDGKTLAFAAEEPDLRALQPTGIELFDVATRKVVSRIRTGEIGIGYLVFSENGRSIVGSGIDITWRTNIVRGVPPSARGNRICQWDIRTRKLQKKVDGEFNMGLAYFRSSANIFVRVPKRDLYVFVDTTNRHNFYDSSSLQPNESISVPLLFDENIPAAPRILQDLKEAQHAVSAHRILAISFDSDGRILAGSSDGSAYAWDIPPQKSSVKGRFGPDTESMAFSRDGTMIAVAGSPETDVVIVDANAGATVQKLPAFSTPARALAFSPDGAWLAGTGSDGAILVWHAKTWQAKSPLTGHQGAVTTFAFSRDSALLASGGNDHIIRIWDMKSGSLIHSLSGHGEKISTVVFGARNDTLASASSADSCVMLWNLKGSSNPKKLKGYLGSIRSLAFSPDGMSLAGGGDETICLWSASTGKLIRELAVRSGTRRNSPPSRGVARFTDTIMVLTFSPDGKLMLCGGMNNTLMLWDAASWKSRLLLRGPSLEIQRH